VLATEPESGAVLAVPPRSVELHFDEVIGERIAAAQSNIAFAVLVSPTTTPVSVGWHRNRISVAVKGGFQPGRIYRVELLPVLVDLHQNRLKQGRTIVFSTGPPIPAARLSGAVVDWTAGRPATGALVEAVLQPDSLPYLALTDSVGGFSIGAVPAGTYLVYGVLDQNNNRRRDLREAFDTARVTLTDTATTELFAFTHDTVGPRLRSAEYVDSLTARITFDRPVNPEVAVDTSMVHVSPFADSTQLVPLLDVYTTAAFDSATKAEAAARAAAQAAKDSAAKAEAAARDTTGRPAPQPPPAAPRPGVRPPPLAEGPRRDTTRAARRDSSLAMKMLARRPAPSDTRVVRFAAPLTPGARYIVVTDSVVGLTGVIAPRPGRTTFSVPRPKPAAPAADSLHRARADTLGAPRDTTPGVPRPASGAAAAPPAKSPPVARDTAPPPAKPR
jgi:hypothetical protein